MLTAIRAWGKHTQPIHTLTAPIFSGSRGMCVACKACQQLEGTDQTIGSIAEWRAHLQNHRPPEHLAQHNKP